MNGAAMAQTTQAGSRWDDALLAAQLFAVDPAGLGGIALRAGPSPIRDLWLDALRGILAPGAPLRRMPCGIADDRLLGGIDLAQTLKAGRTIEQNGLLAQADGGIVLIAMAERLSAQTAARLAAVLDQREVRVEREGISRCLPATIGIVAFDEGADPDEQLPAALAERLAFHLDFDGFGVRGLKADLSAAALQGARARLGHVLPAADEILEALVSAASYFGIQSLVAPMLALRAARAAAALAGRDYITAEDAQLAARLVLAPRALVNPEPEEAEAAPEPNASPQEPPPANNDSQSDSEMPEDLLEDLVLAAVRAALPPGLLDTLKKSAGDRSPPSRRKGTGAMQATLSRGRPAGVRMGPMRSGARLALVETLRAAAPWQRLRQAANKNGVRRVEIRPEDFRIKTFAIPRESTIIFCVDASGSSAFHRLAEAKGAVELLLGEAYAARTYAALIAFRGAGSDMLLPPSRSLARAKALLSMLPGGGGTPLAAGIDAAILTAVAERAKGRSPLIVFLTDGQANIARGGQAGRTAAFAEAMAAAAGMAMQRLAGIFVDTAQRPREEGAKLARAMGARYLALPYAQASAMRDVIRAAMP